MNYAETIEFLYAQLPMFTRVGASAYKKDLHNTIALCDAVGNPQQFFKSIHVAGTNGKGSTSHMLAAVFQSAGYKTGLYTSPHLKDFRERIKINGEWISEQFVIDFTHQAMALITDVEPSFFELTVAMAFDYFAKEKVDIAIIETGLGGRLDSTNIIIPELSIITNIGWDHMNILGDTLAAIASEKAGIIKKNIPVVIGETIPETLEVFLEKAGVEHAPLFLANEQYQTKIIDFHINHLTCEFIDKKANARIIACDLPGLYQQYNIRTVLTSIDILRSLGYELPEKAVTVGLKSVKKYTGLHGRWEVIHESPYVILDVGHNIDGMKQILKNIESINQDNSRAIKMVIGMVKDKDVSIVLSILPRQFQYYFTNAHIPRAMPASQLKEAAVAFQLFGESFDDVNDALQKAKYDAGADDLIIVCGSVFVVGEVVY